MGVNVDKINFHSIHRKKKIHSFYWEMKNYVVPAPVRLISFELKKKSYMKKIDATENKLTDRHENPICSF